MDYLMQLYEKFFGYSNSDENHNNIPRKIVAFGNVLLDHTAQLADDETELLARYNIAPDSKGELDAETLAKLTAEAAERTQCQAHPGGSALNTVRILKQLGTDAMFFGAVGEDEAAQRLKNILKERGITARLSSVPDVPTGQCICIVNKDTKATALYANIGASAKLSTEHLIQAERDASQAFLRPIERKQIIYIEGFFLPQRQNVCEFIVKNYIRERRRLALNLSAVYIVRENFAQIRQLARMAFFIFGNANEFAALSEQMNCSTLEETARQLIEECGNAPKVIVITNGHEGVQLISNYEDEYSPPGEITFQRFNVPQVGNVLDTTGAGDSFVGAFMHAWLEKRSLSECVRVAADVAAKVVTVVGCNLPEDLN